MAHQAITNKAVDLLVVAFLGDAVFCSRAACDFIEERSAREAGDALAQIMRRRHHQKNELNRWGYTNNDDQMRGEQMIRNAWDAITFAALRLLWIAVELWP